jgi:putative flippase GtrA
MIDKLQRYIVTGGAAAVADVFGFHCLLLLRLPIALAAALSWLIAAFVNYHLTSRLVFRSSGSPKRLLQFLLGAAAGALRQH